MSSLSDCRAMLERCRWCRQEVRATVFPGGVVVLGPHRYPLAYADCVGSCQTSRVLSDLEIISVLAKVS